MEMTATLAAALWLTAMAGNSLDAIPRGVPVASLSEFATARGGVLEDDTNGYVTLTTRYRQVQFVPSVRRILLDGIAIYMNAPFETNTAGGRLAAIDAETVLHPLLLENGGPPLPSTPPLVVLDPGHGGSDPGARGCEHLVEKDVVLDIAKRVASALAQTGIAVELTREHDHFLTLEERVNMASRLGAHVFVSIHLNSSDNPEAGGVETYVLPARGFPSTSNGTSGNGEYPGNVYDVENVRLAYFVQKGLLYQTRAEDRGVRRARFEVLRYANCPAILTECGFVTNRGEARRLKQRAYCERIAQGIASGLMTYISRRE